MPFKTFVWEKLFNLSMLLLVFNEECLRTGLVDLCSRNNFWNLENFHLFERENLWSPLFVKTKVGKRNPHLTLKNWVSLEIRFKVSSVLRLLLKPMFSKVVEIKLSKYPVAQILARFLRKQLMTILSYFCNSYRKTSSFLFYNIV